MIEKIDSATKEFSQLLEQGKRAIIVSHYDADGICSASIIAKALLRKDKLFQIKILKQLDKSTIKSLKIGKNDFLVFLDLGSSHISEIESFPCPVFILDHHEITASSKKVTILNPRYSGEDLPASGIAYLFAKQLDEKNKDLVSLSIIGMLGDLFDKNISKLANMVLKDAENIEIKKTISIVSPTKPLNKALEYSSIFIPGVTGSSEGAFNLIKETGIKMENKKTLLDLTEEEVSKLITSIVMKRLGNQINAESIIGNVYLIKFFNKKEDAKEISTLINACSRLGYPEIALLFCLGNKEARIMAEDLYLKYKKEIIYGLNVINTTEKIKKDGYVIFNAKNKIRDTMIGTLMSILSHSSIYPENTILIGMAHSKDAIKVSGRICGNYTKSNLDLKKILDPISSICNGELGGHERAAGCIVSFENEAKFIEKIQQILDTESIKIKV